jgi:hypothetical protein
LPTFPVVRQHRDQRTLGGEKLLNVSRPGLKTHVLFRLVLGERGLNRLPQREDVEED